MVRQMILVIAIISATVLIWGSIPHLTFAQACPPGEFPDIDANGDPIYDPITSMPVCIPASSFSP